MYMTVLKMTRDSILNATDLLDINSSNAVHKWLTNQQDISRADGKILYKILKRDDEIYMYIQSKDRFNLNGLYDYGFVYIKDFEIDNIPEICSFDVQTFPNNYDNSKRKRNFIFNINDRYQWLRNYFQRNGIELLECVEYKQSSILIDKDTKKFVATASYKGKMRVIDTEKAKELIENGMGKMKNYGLGLILFK